MLTENTNKTTKNENEKTFILDLFQYYLKSIPVKNHNISIKLPFCGSLVVRLTYVTLQPQKKHFEENHSRADIA